nr:MAG TPA: hypothetical protein [Caudoviricetes sp.]
MVLLYAYKANATGCAWERMSIRHLQSNTNYPLNGS